MDVQTRRFVRSRSGERCEYCLLPEHSDEWSFHIDHIIAKNHAGDDDPGNLAWSCSQCNWHKGMNFASFDPGTREKTDLFNPRMQTWKEHFSLHDTGEIEGDTRGHSEAVAS
ncbi:MAG: HNH endonuclease signature motif containing protein [Planctomycetota bacterium]